MTQGGRSRQLGQHPEEDRFSGIRIVSSNDHIVEPPDLFVDAAARGARDRVPHVVDLGDEQAWEFGGKQWHFGHSACAGIDPLTFTSPPVRYEHMRPSCFDPQARISDLDLDGIWASACFPSVIGYAGQRLLDVHDRRLANWCVRTYNDFLISEWCATAPSRLIPIAILPLDDPVAAAREVERTVAEGARGIAFPVNPALLGLDSWHSDTWTPVFSAAAEAEVPLCLHFATQPPVPSSQDAFGSVPINACNLESMLALIELLHSPVPGRHPTLRFHLTEGSIGWIPYVLEKADYYWVGRAPYLLSASEFEAAPRPSELFPRRFCASFIEDYFGLEVRGKIGVENLTWQSDFPHPDGSFPNSLRWLARQFEGVPDHEARLVLETNPASLFGLDLAGQQVAHRRSR